MQQVKLNRVVVTGMGAVTPIGNTVKEYEVGLFSGRNGIGPITLFDTSEHSVKLAAEVRDLDFDAFVEPRMQKRMDRYTLLAMVAAGEALEHSNLLGNGEPDRDRIGVIIGSGIGGIGTFEEQYVRMQKRGPRHVSPLFVPMMISDIAAGYVSIEYGLKGPNFSIVSACATASHSIGEAYRNIQVGSADAMVAGGAEAPVTPASVAGFTSMRAMTKNPDPETACRPFDAERDGFVMGEGSGILVLEALEYAQERGANILGELVGYGATGDAYHITAPAEGGEGAVRAMNLAIKGAGIEPQDVGYVNAHGTSTAFNDKNETAAIKTVFGNHAYDGLIVSSTKSMTGHLMGASGGVEAIASLLALKRQEIPPTIHYQASDPECDLNYSPNSSTSHSFDYALSNTFGFGGHNAVLTLKRFTD